MVRQSTPIVWRLPNAVGLSTVSFAWFLILNSCSRGSDNKDLMMSARSSFILRAFRSCVLRNEVVVCAGRRSYSYRAAPCKRTVTNASRSSVFAPPRRQRGLKCCAPWQAIFYQTRTISSAPAKHRVFVALGSNLGDRINMIEQACNLLDKHDEIKILRTSCLWETKAMYVEDQADFLNGACEVGMLHGAAGKGQKV